jgi:hypothetical protein
MRSASPHFQKGFARANKIHCGNHPFPMSKADIKRFDESIEYISKNISAHLALDLSLLNKDTVGARLSLEGFHYMPIGYDEQHKAVRALLLCQHHFLGAYAMPDDSKRFFKSKSKEQINRYIKAFITDNPSLEKLAQKAENYACQDGILGFYQRNREDNKFGGGAIICYTGVLLWLFQAGFVTLKWYMDNNGMNAYNCNQILGRGQEWDIGRIDQIPRGWIWNFQGIRSEVCHWGISLGGGRAAGTNNHMAEGNKRVTFEEGGLTYGKFDLLSQYEVLRIKYGEADVRAEGEQTNFVRKTGIPTKLFVINPMLIVFN